VFLASCCTNHNLAWDCATGNGQAARSLIPHFASVIATDASGEQIASAETHTGVEFRVASAEASELPSESVDLVTVAQALHWFDIDEFFVEACRVLRPGGVLAIWCYEHCQVDHAIDGWIMQVYSEVEEYWPPERDLVERRYADIELPVAGIKAKNFRMQVSWTAADMLDYVRTWSASQRYLDDKGADPTAKYADELRAAWGHGRRAVVWPLTLRIGRR